MVERSARSRGRKRRWPVEVGFWDSIRRIAARALGSERVAM